jgi:hypothetical protein
MAARRERDRPMLMLLGGSAAWPIPRMPHDPVERDRPMLMLLGGPAAWPIPAGERDRPMLMLLGGPTGATRASAGGLVEVREIASRELRLAVPEGRVTPEIDALFEELAAEASGLDITR